MMPPSGLEGEETNNAADRGNASNANAGSGGPAYVEEEVVSVDEEFVEEEFIDEYHSTGDDDERRRDDNNAENRPDTTERRLSGGTFAQTSYRNERESDSDDSDRRGNENDVDMNNARDDEGFGSTHQNDEQGEVSENEEQIELETETDEDEQIEVEVESTEEDQDDNGQQTPEGDANREELYNVFASAALGRVTGQSPGNQGEEGVREEQYHEEETDEDEQREKDDDDDEERAHEDNQEEFEDEYQDGRGPPTDPASAERAQPTFQPGSLPVVYDGTSSQPQSQQPPAATKAPYGKPSQTRGSSQQENPCASIVTQCLLCFICILLCGALVLMVLLLIEDDDPPVVRIVTDPTPRPSAAPTGLATPSPARAPFPGTLPPSVLPTFSGIRWDLDATFIQNVDGFGTAVALSGNFMAATAPDSDQVFLYFLSSSGDWLPTETLTPDSDNTDFGASVAIRSRTMAIGAPGTLNEDGTPSGSVRVYEFDTISSLWEQQLVLRAADDEEGSEFGTAVDLGSVSVGTFLLVVGLPFNDNGRGRVATFEYNRATGTLTNSFPDLDGTGLNDAFGTTLSISDDGSRLLVGAPGRNSVSYYEWTGNSWNLIQTTAGENDEEFGFSVKILSSEGTTFAVGGPGFNNGAGRIVVFEQLEDGTVEQKGEPLEGKAGESLGVAFDGQSSDDEIFVVAGTSNGVVRRFDFIEAEGQWISAIYAPVDTGFGGEVSSLAVSLFPTRFVAGSRDAGEIFVYLDPNSLTEPPTGAEASTPQPSLEPTPFPTTIPLEWESSGGPFTPGIDGFTGFGSALALTEGFMAVGARFVLSVGGVLTYSRVNNRWVSGRQVFGDQEEGNFGAAIAMAGIGLLVGAPYVDAPGTPTSAGAAYYYEYNDGLWEQVGSVLFGADGVFAADEEFGFSVGLNSNRQLVVGAPGNSLNFSFNRGRVYIFSWSGTDFVLVEDLLGMQSSDGFGTSVDISEDGNVIVVGAPASGAGFAEIYALVGTTWTSARVINGVEEKEGMGRTVKILTPDGSYVAVGAPNYNGGAGRVVVYERNGNTYDQVGGDIVGEAGDELGQTGMLDGTDLPTVFLGAASGLVRHYALVDGQWTLAAEIDSGLARGLLSVAASSPTQISVGGDEQAIVFELR